jgi:hypothetical protein
MHLFKDPTSNKEEDPKHPLFSEFDTIPDETEPSSIDEFPRFRSMPSVLTGCISSCSLVTLIIAVLVLICGVFVVYQTTDFFDSFFEGVQDLLGIGEGSEAEVVDAKVILLGIRKMAVLQTASDDIQVEEKVVKEKTSILKDAKLYIRYIGRVTAGIDLSLIEDDDITVGLDQSVVIKLPPAQITGCYLQNPEVIDSTCGTSFLGASDCDAIIEDMRQEAYEKGLQYLLEAAENDQLLDHAYLNAEEAIIDLLKDLTLLAKSSELPSDGTMG